MSLPSNTQTLNPPEKGYSSAPAGYLLGRFGLLVMLAVLLLAAWFGQTVIVVLIGLALSAAGLARFWSRLSLTGVQCQRFLDERRLFPGEYVELKLRLVNRKLLPLPWVQVDDEIPDGLTPDTPLVPGGRPGRGLLSNTVSLLWYTGINWRYRLRCDKRGYYPLGPIVATSGDIFGFYPRSVTQPLIDHIIVYPQLFPLAELGLPSIYPLGETKAERRIFEDPTRTIGVRDYTPRDSLRHIHWKASARHQKLQVKVFEPTTTLNVALFLAVDSFQDSQGDGVEENFELGVSTAASIANYVVRQRSPVGLYANTSLPDSVQAVRIPPGGGVSQLVNILEALAKVMPLSGGSFDDFLQGEMGNLTWGTTVIMVISRLPDSLPWLLTRLREVGHRPLVLQIGERQDEAAEYATAWYNIRNPGDLTGFNSGEPR